MQVSRLLLTHLHQNALPTQSYCVSLSVCECVVSVFVHACALACCRCDFFMLPHSGQSQSCKDCDKEHLSQPAYNLRCISSSRDVTVSSGLFRYLYTSVYTHMHTHPETNAQTHRNKIQQVDTFLVVEHFSVMD